MPDLKMGMTLAILRGDGTIPVARDWLNMWTSGSAIELAIFFRRHVDRPVMSVVFLFSSLAMVFKSSSVEMGEECRSNEGDGGDGWRENELSVGWIFEAILSAMVVK